MIYVVGLEVPLESTKMTIYLNQKAQIAFLLIKKVRILEEYSNFANVFSKEKALVLLEQTKLNKHAIELKKGKQLP